MDSSLVIEINGQIITGRVDGISNFTVNTSIDDDKVIKATYSNELTFYDDGYALIKSALIDDPNGFAKELPVKVYDSVCDKAVFEGSIKGDTIDWCEPDCFVKSSLMKDDPVASCIQNKLIWDDTYGFLQQDYFPLKYCIVNRPLFLHVLILFIANLINVILTAIFAIVTFLTVVVNSVVYGICQLVNLVGNINCSSFDPGSIINNAIQGWTQIESFLNPCGNFHPTPFVRDYINNVCKICGISGFDSSILNDPSSPYYNTLMFAGQIKKGNDNGSTNKKLISDNKPVETLSSLMENYLMPLFNADYRIINNRLIFERKDYFYLTNQIWINTDNILNDQRLIDNQICFSWTGKKKYSYGRFEYAKDNQEYIGSEAIFRWSDIIEWNPPSNMPGEVYSDAQKGEYALLLQCSPARFDGDGLGGVEAVTQFAGLGISFNGNDNIMCMSQQTAMNYKFLIADVSDWDKGRIKTGYDDTFCGGYPGMPASERFNYPFWFLEGYDNNLYSKFHYIENPRLPYNTKWDFNFKFEFNCNELASFNLDKLIAITKNGVSMNGIVREVSFDFINRIATVKGEI